MMNVRSSSSLTLLLCSLIYIYACIHHELRNVARLYMRMERGHKIRKKVTIHPTKFPLSIVYTEKKYYLTGRPPLRISKIMNKLANVQPSAAGHLNGLTMASPANNGGAATVTGAISGTKRFLQDHVRNCVTAYGASLVMTGVMMPFVSSVILIGLYLALPNWSISLSPFLYLDPHSNWYTLVYSSLLAALFWMIAALLYTPFSTAIAANMRSYGLLRGRLCQLKANLNIEGTDNDLEMLEAKFPDIKTAVDKIKEIKKNTPANASCNCNSTARTDALACYIDISKMFHQSPTGLLWALGIGYINAWSLMHHAEEALIEFECKEEVMRGAMHDKLAIHGSTIHGKEELLDKLMQAVNVLDPAAEIYFKDNWPDKNCAALFELTEAFKKKALKQLMAENGLESDDKNKAGHNVEYLARVALREVRSALNDFRDKSWEGIVRARNKLLAAIALTGIVTHILLGVAILTSAFPDSKHPATALIAATAFYLTGAVTGMFGRFYRESLAGNAIDDYGFAVTRLIATPLLSGLAGVGGVLFTVMLAALGGSAVGDTMPHPVTLDSIFHMDPRLLFAAAIFGLTPNLLIKGLQEKAQKYETDIQSSKTTEPEVVSAKG